MLVLAAGLLLCDSAAAAEVAISVSEEPSDHGQTVTVAIAEYAAAAGEANDVALRSDADTLIIHDAGAAIAAGAGCALVDDHTARCLFGPAIRGTRFLLGDGDDRLRIDGAGLEWHLRVRGGRGADGLDARGAQESTLLGDAGDDVLTGADDTDYLEGGDGADVLDAGGGRDFLIGGIGDDVIDGGASDDALSYAERTRAVYVDLSEPARGGERGENDRLVGIEEVRGGRGDDVLLGGPGRDSFFGNDGRNVLRGRAGPDTLFGGAHADTLGGGAGGDILYGGGSGDRLTGGPGDDSLSGGGGSDLLLGAAGDDVLWPGEAGRFDDVAACGAGADHLFMPERVRPPPIWRDCERADIDDLLRVHAWRLGRERVSLRIGLSFDFRLGGSCSMVLSTGVDRVRVRALRRDQVRPVRLRVPSGRVVPLRVRPLARSNGHSRPLFVRLVRRP